VQLCGGGCRSRRGRRGAGEDGEEDQHGGHRDDQTPTGTVHLDLRGCVGEESPWVYILAAGPRNSCDPSTFNGSIDSAARFRAHGATVPDLPTGRRRRVVAGSRRSSTPRLARVLISRRRLVR